MSKELDEAWTTIYHYNDEIIHDMGSEYIENPLKEEIDIVNNALLELKVIKEANPSEALKCLGDLEKYFYNKWKSTYFLEDKPKELNIIDTIEQSLLKAQEQEKVLEILFKKQVDLGWFWYCIHECVNSLNEYNKKMPIEKFKLTEKEFELLKEWS